MAKPTAGSPQPQLIPGIPRWVHRGWFSPSMPPNMAFCGTQEPVPHLLKTQGSCRPHAAPQPKPTVPSMLLWGAPRSGGRTKRYLRDQQTRTRPHPGDQLILPSPGVQRSSSLCPPHRAAIQALCEASTDHVLLEGRCRQATRSSCTSQGQYGIRKDVLAFFFSLLP